MSREALRSQVLRTAARLFLEQGYTATTVREISKESEVEINSMVRAFGNKANILCELVEYVLEGQFAATEQFLKGVTDDPLLFYAAETTLQLYMAESGEQIRDLYSAAYSMPESSALIMRRITEKLEQLFKAYQPDLETKDFYEFEIATGGVMRGFMTVPCDLYFTMDRKVRRFIECVFRIFQVPEEKIAEAIAFVKRFDYPHIARQTIDNMFAQLGAAFE